MTSEYYQKMFESQQLLRLQGASEDKVKNAFFANYLAALLLLKLQDLKGLLLINDAAHADLKKFSPGMSDVNFWGRAMFYSLTPDVKRRMLAGHAELLNQDAGRVMYARVHTVMKAACTPPDQLNWTDIVASLILLRERFMLRSSYFNRIVYALSRWDSLGQAARRKAVNDSFMFLLQSDSRSALMSRMRALSNSVAINAFDALAARLVAFKRLHEDEGTSTGEIGSLQSGNAIITPPTFDVTSNNSSTNSYVPAKMSKHQVSKKTGLVIKDGRIIKKKVKGFHPKKFKAPAGYTAVSSNQEED